MISLSIAFYFCILGEPLGEDIVIGQRRSVTSKILGEKREVWIATPRGYESRDDRYGVLYLLDGPGHFHHTTGITQFLAEQSRMPPLIVVGVSHTDRTRELTPHSAQLRPSDPGEVGGGASNFLRFLTDELTPWIDSEYRTRPVRILVGHSFGGLFALHSMITRPDFFQGLIAISPSLQWSDQESVRDIQSWLEQEPECQASVYITIGNEGAEMLGGIHQVCGFLAKDAPDEMRWKFHSMPEETHGSVPHRSTYDGLEYLFDGWSLRQAARLYEAGGFSAIENALAQARGRFGYSSQVTLDTVYVVMTDLMSHGKFTPALQFATEAQDRHLRIPPDFWQFLARRFEDRKEIDNAIACYSACLESFPNQDAIRERLKALGAKPPVKPPKVDVPPSVLSQWSGVYQLSKLDVEVTIEVKDGALIATIPGQAPQALVPTSPKHYTDNAGSEYAFDAIEGGIELTIEGFGQKWVTKRLEKSPN